MLHRGTHSQKYSLQKRISWRTFSKKLLFTKKTTFYRDYTSTMYTHANYLFFIHLNVVLVVFIHTLNI